MDWKGRIRGAAARAGHVLDDDVVEELAAHAQAMYERARADGCSPQDAERQVDLQVTMWGDDAGLLTRPRHSARVLVPPAAESSFRAMGLARDVRYAARLLRRQPAFTLLVTATMALAIGATTTLFSLVHGVLVRPLPWPAGDRAVLLKETRGGHSPRFGAFTNAAYLAWQEKATTVDAIAAWSQGLVTLADGGDPERLRVTEASASLFRVLGVRPLAGRLFTAADETNAAVVVISESLWRQRYGADPGVLGRVIKLDGEAHRVIGVLADALAFPDQRSRAWVPFRVEPAVGNLLSMFSAVARLRPGVTPAQAAAEATVRGRFAADTGMTTMAIFGSTGPIQVSAVPLQEALVADVRRPLVVLLAAVVLLLAAAIANVANLQLARATTRRREVAIRAALGAGAATVTRQLLLESLLLGLLGGAAGLALAWLLHAVLPSILPADFPRLGEVGLDRTAVAFAVLLSMLAGVAFGLLPALHVRRLNLVDSLADDGNRAAGAAGSGSTRLRAVIMAAQVAIACMLLVGGALLGRSFVALLHADRGYDPSGIVTARLSFSAAGYSPHRRFDIASRILERLGSVPGVQEAAFTSEMPLTPGGSTAGFTLRSPRTDGGVVTVQASPRVVSPRLFRALRMHVLTGRGFADSDTETAPAVVVVNRAFARRYLGDAPLGVQVPKGVGYADFGTTATIVGVIDDVRYLTAADSSQPEIYLPFTQLGGTLPVPVVTLLVRADGETTRLLSALRTAVREADPELAPDAVGTLEDRMVTALARPRLYAVMLAGFAALALLLAAVGLFGVMSYTVALRSRELAVRVALGARPADIARLVMRQGLGVTLAGLTAGLLGSAWLTRALSALLYGVREYDTITYFAVPLVVLAAAAVSCIVPARRASRLDPLRLLKTG